MSISLQSGSTISHYRVISPLGAGGMGEVYVAQDLTLERAVALKILPPELTKNEERVRRFIQEAKSASSLSHPHIVTIYEIGQAQVRTGDAPEAESAGGTAIHFIAMELISGETLKHKIHREKADLRTLLRYLAQAAEGLAKAHAAGIVHRDLKPENIMIAKDGYAKVLDFGLAKLTERKEVAEGGTSALTATRETREGAVMGTVGYMSPEQVQGRVVDHRSDMFSFGCILYEAATRTRPFSADSDVETMHKILRDKPTPIEELNPEAPAELRRLIRRCLAKTPDQRLQSMKDLAIELNEIVEEFEELSISSGSRTHASGPSASGNTATVSGSRGVRLGIAAAVVLGITGIAFGTYVWFHRAGAGTNAPAPFQTMKMTRLTSSGKVQGGALSPDGKYLANVVKEAGKYGLWVKQVATGSDVQIVAPLQNPFRGVSFSPDGNYVYYVNQETGGPGYSILYQIPVLGGSARKLIFDIDTAVTFSPDGKKLSFVRGYPQSGESALMVANADGTGEKKLAVRKRPDGFPILAPSWSSDGKWIAAIATSLEGGFHSEVMKFDAGEGKYSPIGSKRWLVVSSLAWVPNGSGLVLTAADQIEGNGQVWALSYPDAEARRISNDLNGYIGISVTADSKALATTQTHLVSNLWISPASDTTAARQITFGSGDQDAIGGVAAAGADSVVFVAAEGDFRHLWRIGSDGSNRTRLTPESTRNFGLAVSGDGQVIVFNSVREDGLAHIWRMDREGGNLTPITSGKGEILAGLSPDGRWILHGVAEKLGLWKLPVAGGAPVKIADDFLGDAVFSPNGKLIAYEGYIQKDGLLRRSISVIPSDGGTAIQSLPYPDGFRLHWAPAGDAVTYYREVEGVSNIWRQALDGTPPKQMTDFKSGQIFSYDWAPDGKTLVLSRGQETSDVVLISNFH